jgi:hypothetical protein
MFFRANGFVEILTKALLIVNRGEELIAAAREQGYTEGYLAARKEKFEAMTKNAVEAKIKPSMH